MLTTERIGLGESLLEAVAPLVSVEAPAASGKTVVDLLCNLSWHSAEVSHNDWTWLPGLSAQRDILPPGLAETVAVSTPGERITQYYSAGSLLPPADSACVLDIERGDFTAPVYKGAAIEPAVGRFYPRRFVAAPARNCVGNPRMVHVGEKLRVDFNHPLAGVDLRLDTVPVQWRASNAGAHAPLDMVGQLCGNGPGMQARCAGQPTDFGLDGALRRDDEMPDTEFYAAPRMVSHIDSTASRVISAIYQAWLPDGARLLDLMASWESHLPAALSYGEVQGLGLNREELVANHRFDEIQQQDLNADPRLPYDPETFNVVVCSLSIEYLIHPRKIFAEIGRVLVPGGIFIVTFSNRWFPTKSIRVWEMLHEYERLGLVSEYFLQSGVFEDIRTCALRGLPRPPEDRYAQQLSLSDPVYAVAGTRAG